MLVKRMMIVALLAPMTLACRDHASPPLTPSAPLVPMQPSPPAAFTLSGVVYEISVDGRRPVADAQIDVSVEYQSWPPKTVSDAEGRYRISGMSGSLKVIAGKAGYSQPCRTPVALTADRVVDIYLVPDAILSTTGVPSSFPVVQPTLSGFVFEETPNGRSPIAGASVVGDFTGGLGWAPSAATRSDAAGRYLLCAVADIGLGLALLVDSPGYQSSFVAVDLRSTATFDVKLTRK